MTGPLTGYEAESIAEVGAVLDDSPANASEVYQRTIGHSERAIAAVAAKRAGSGGGSLPDPFVIAGTGEFAPPADADLSNGYLHVQSAFNENSADGDPLIYADTLDGDRLFDVRDDGSFIYRSGDGSCVVSFRSQDQTASLNYNSLTGLSLVSGGTQRFGITPTGVGFYGVVPAAQPAAPVTLDDVIAALQALGLVAS